MIVERVEHFDNKKTYYYTKYLESTQNIKTTLIWVLRKRVLYFKRVLNWFTPYLSLKALVHMVSEPEVIVETSTYNQKESQDPSQTESESWDVRKGPTVVGEV